MANLSAEFRANPNIAIGVKVDHLISAGEFFDFDLEALTIISGNMSYFFKETFDGFFVRPSVGYYLYTLPFDLDLDLGSIFTFEPIKGSSFFMGGELGYLARFNSFTIGLTLGGLYAFEDGLGSNFIPIGQFSLGFAF